MVEPVLLIHGGAWAMPDDAVASHEQGIQTALRAGWALLSQGGSALDAVQAAITAMEDDETFDAGRGSFLTRDGRVQLDALMMSGADLRAGGIACVERIRNPIQAARLVLDQSPHVYLVGEGAEVFAARNGISLIPNDELVIPREQERLTMFQRAEAAGEPDLTFAGSSSPVALRPAPDGDLSAENMQVEQAVNEALPAALQFEDPILRSHDTVGALALDVSGNLAAGTSTGGTLAKTPGRVGDSSLIGCGCYADNDSAAVSLTGWGEPIMKLVLGKWAVDRVATGDSPQAAAEAAIAYLYSRLRGHGGIILLNRAGQIGLAHNTPRMAWALATRSGERWGTQRTS